MKETNKEQKKMPVVAITLVALVGIVGGTFAYFTSEAVFPNVFQTKTYQTELTEKFTAPDNWTPGTQTQKEVIVKNTGEIPVAARVSYTESWVSSSGTTLPNTLEDGSKVVEIHMPDATNWINYNGWFYYNKALNQNETATFMDYVTFNENVEINYTEENVYTYTDDTTSTGTTPVEGKTVKQVTKKFKTNETGYAGATYTLTITIQTVQYDAYENQWSVSKDNVNIRA